MSTADTQQKLLTAEEFADVAPAFERPCDLVEGVIVMSPQPSFSHGAVCARIARILGNYAEDQQLGWVLTNDSGVITKRGPDTVRGADVAFYSYASVAKHERPRPYAKNPPELVFEVKSPSDRWPEIDRKVAEYLKAGVQAVCVVDPDSETAIVHRAGGPSASLAVDDELQFPEILGKFCVTVGELLE